jgi:hypothetical protein
MGGPIALTTLKRSGRHGFGGLVGVATSAFWVRPRYQLKVGAAPLVLSPNSFVTMSRQRAEGRRNPDHVRMIAWEYAVRPHRRILEESADELRRFDARRWADLSLPPALWVVTTEDGVVAPADQRISARELEVPTVDMHSDHRLTNDTAPRLAEILETATSEWSRRLPIGVRPRATRPS